MIISHKHRYVFVEVPHTASHSISQQLVKHYDGEAILRHHGNITQFLGQASADEKSYFKFATVRNPLDTAVTDYSKLLGNHKGQFTNPTALLKNGGFITEQHLGEFRFIHDNNADFPSFFRKFRQMLYNNWFLIGNQHFDQVIRFESLQSSFSDVLNKLDIEQQEEIGHVNPTKAKRKKFADFYTREILADVAKCYGPFLKKWGYEFPVEWGEMVIPRTAELQFKFLDKCASLASNYFTLDPDNKALHQAKKLVDLATRRH